MTDENGALPADDLSHELWNSDRAPNDRDRLGNIAKFSPATVANGRVYCATFSNKIVVYGALT